LLTPEGLTINLIAKGKEVEEASPAEGNSPPKGGKERLIASSSGGGYKRRFFKQ